MDCPSCHTQKLSPIKLESDLPAYGCNDCQGALISLLYYRDWSERTGCTLDGEEIEALKDISSDDSHKALSCPKCKHLMRKYLVSGSSDHRIDLCSSCDEVWLDAGEWQWLKALHLHKEIVSVLSEKWQQRVKQEVLEQKHRVRFEKIVGTKDIQKAEAFRIWLKDHPLRQEIIYYISR